MLGVRRAGSAEHRTAELVETEVGESTEGANGRTDAPTSAARKMVVGVWCKATFPKHRSTSDAAADAEF